MKAIKRFGSGAPWEPIVGYARAVRAGEWLLISGTTSFNERGEVIGRGQNVPRRRAKRSAISPRCFSGLAWH
jgi:enamine deaminase RidA (YjgF/YER057c/UK114 family)